MKNIFEQNLEPCRAGGVVYPSIVTRNPRKDMTMNWDQIEGKWMQLKGKAKATWGELTDDELDVVAGKRDQLAGKVQERYGIAKEEAERRVDEWSKTV